MIEPALDARLRNNGLNLCSVVINKIFPRVGSHTVTFPNEIKGRCPKSARRNTTDSVVVETAALLSLKKICDGKSLKVQLEINQPRLKINPDAYTSKGLQNFYIFSFSFSKLLAVVFGPVSVEELVNVEDATSTLLTCYRI